MSENYVEQLRADVAVRRAEAQRPGAGKEMAFLKDGQARMPADALAKRVALNPEDLAKVGGRSTVIDRTSSIPVLRNEGSDEVTSVVAAPPIIPRVQTGPRRTDALDDLEKAAGVITIQPQMAGGRATRETPKTVSHVVAPARVAPQTIVQAPAAPVVTGSPQVLPATVKRVTVQLSSPTIGRHRLKVAQVLVSATVVVLAYVDDDDSTIYEPPETGDGQAITVEYDGQVYQCAYLGQSVSQPVLNSDQQLLLVVLVRVDQ